MNTSLLRKYLWSLIALCLLCLGTTARADRLYWTGALSDNWSTPGNWRTLANTPSTYAPTSDTVVFIGVDELTGVAALPKVSSIAACETLNIEGPDAGLTITSGKLEVEKSASIAGWIELSGGVLHVKLSANVGGTNSDGIPFVGSVVVTGGEAIFGACRVAPGSNIDLAGSSGLIRMLKAHSQTMQIYDLVAERSVTSWDGRGTPELEYSFAANDVTITPGPAIDRGQAYHPVPAHNTMNALRAVTLSWSPGDHAVSHEIHFGTTPTNLPLVATQTGTTLARTLAADTDYYWKVVEVLANGTRISGPVWRLAATTPRSFWATQPVSPGKIALVQGVGYQNVRVQVARLAPGTGTTFNTSAALNMPNSQPVLTDPGVLNSLAWVDAEVALESPTSVHFVIPANFPPGVYAYKITNRKENNQNDLSSPAYLLNIPQQLWVMGDRGKSATPGGTIRVTGICTGFTDNSTPAIALVNANNQIIRRINASVKGVYSSQFTIPANLPPGDAYRIFISNGHGQGGGWQLCPTDDYNLSAAQHFSIRPAPVLNTAVYPIDPNPANNPGGKTAEATFVDAIALAGALVPDPNDPTKTVPKGGTIRFKAGNFTFSTGYIIPGNTVVEGAGMNATTLTFNNGMAFTSGRYGFLIKSNSTLREIGLVQAPAAQMTTMVSSIPLLNEVKTNVTVRNIKYTMNTNFHEKPVGIFLAGNGPVVQGCVGTGAATGISIKSAERALVTGNKFERGGGLIFQPVNGAVVENNIANNSGHNMTIYGGSSSENMYFANNQLGSAPDLTGQTHWTLDGGSGMYFGYADSATSTPTGGTLTLAGPPDGRADAWASQFGVFVLGGRGAGQWRRVVSHNYYQTNPRPEKMTMVLDQPWDIVPDSTSVVTVVGMLGRITLHNNLFSGDTEYVVAYSFVSDYLMDGNTFNLRLGARCVLLAGGGAHHESFMPGWHYQLLNNTVNQGEVAMGVANADAPRNRVDGTRSGMWYHNQPVAYGFACRNIQVNERATAAGTRLTLGTVSGFTSPYRTTGGIVEDCRVQLGEVGNMENLVISNSGWEPTPTPLANRLHFRLDASDKTSVVGDNAGVISRWNNLAPAGAGGYAEQVSIAARPSWLAGQLNGMPVVDFGSYGSGRWMQFMGSAGEIQNFKSIRTVFWVMKGSNFLLSDDNTHHFHRKGVTTSPTTPLWDTRYANAAVLNGKTYLNGGLINGSTAGLPAQYSLVSLVTTGNVEASRLCFDRNFTGRTGGQQVAELLVYNTVLTDAERQQVEAYLRTKWLTVYP